MKKNRITHYLFVSLFLLFISTYAHAQCDYDVNVVQQKISDCWSNGIVKATLSGTNVNNGNVQTHDAQFSIESVTPGGYSTAFSKNNGIIENVPPGTYTVTVAAYCKGNWIYKTSGPVTIQGTYIEVNTNAIQVQSANIEKSMACVGTGKIPIKMQGGGKEPFTLTITNAPASYSGPMVFNNLPAGVFTISNLTSGNYSFEWSDDCDKRYVNLNASVGVINPVFSATVKQHARTCLNEGRIEVSADKGLRPYTITITAAPAGYPVPVSFPMADHGTQMIENLPYGNYTVKIEDACGYSRTFSRTVNEIKFPDPNPAKVTNSEPCNPTGKISFDLKNGVRPYTIELVTKPVSYTPGSTIFTQNSDGTFTLSNLPAGNYVFKAKDGCNVEYTIPAVIAANPLKITGSTSTKSASCKTDGSITINGIGGGKAPYKIEMTGFPAGYAGNKIFSPVNAGNYKISNLPVGDYTFKITDACVPSSGTLAVNEKVDTIKMDPPKLTAVASSLYCLPTGKMTIYVGGGTPPYKIIVDSVPGVAWPAPGITHPFDKTQPNPGYVYVENLPNGQYMVIVIDDCGERDTIAFNKTIINTITGGQIPGNPFEDYFYAPSSIDKNCKNLRARRKNLSSSNPLYPYWNGTNSEKYFEVKFVYQGDTTAWQPLKEYTNYTLPTSYLEFRTPPGKSVEAIVRLKGDVDTCELYVHDFIKIKDVKSTVTPGSNACAGFELRFNQTNGQEGILCYPYKWRLVHGTDTIRSGDNINHRNVVSVYNVFPYGNYVLHFEDKEGYKWQESFAVNWSNPNTNASITTHNYLCASYSASFVPNLCFPYDWALVDSATNVLHSSKTAVPDNAKQTITGLLYNITYKLTVTDKLGDSKDFYIKFERKQLFDFDIDSDALKCFPELGKGSMRIFRDNNQNFPVGTQIRYVSGPGGAPIPKHANVTINSSHGSVKNFYPYSTDSLFTKKTYEYMPQGIYKFDIIDSCGTTNTLEIDYKVYSSGNMTYTERTSCMGSYIFPTGDIWYGTTLQQPWFRIKSAPSGIMVDPGSVTTGGSLFLPESGKYVIQMSLDNSPTSCPIDTLEIEFEKKSVSLDADATIAYICDTLLPGYIFVRAIGGEGPYKFELYDNGVLQSGLTQTTTGDCHLSYGKLGETYEIRVTDIGCGVSFPQHVTMLDISEQRFIYGTQQVCYGDNIYLNSITISKTYSWTGPNGFTSILQNPVINNADTIMSGNYTITILPQGCMQNIQQSVAVDVYLPKEPLGDTIKIMCLNSPSQQLIATALPWHKIQWYAPDGVTKLPQAPFPPTNKVDTITYWVSQISDTLGCESPKKPVVAIIDDLPKPLIGGNSPTVCVGDTALIILPTTDLNYTYIIYNAATGGDSITSGIGTGGQITMKASVPVFSNTRYYIEIINTNQCHGPSRTPVDIKVELLPPMPDAKDRNIICLNTATGPLDATALPGYFLQWYDTDKVTPLPGAPIPPTHQVDTIVYYVSQKSNGLQCESDKKPITVIISDLPGLIPNVVADSICPDAIPVIVINNSMRDYTYSLYDAPVGGVFMGSVKGTGGSVTLAGTVPLVTSTIYYIASFNEYLCEGLQRTPVPIKVVASPPKPVADTVTIICLNSPSQALIATADPGHYLQWYAADGVTKLAQAPYPPTNKVDTITYYVSQLSIAMDCESEKVPVVAIIDDLPKALIGGYSPTVCVGDTAVIILPNTNLNYTYIVYSASTGGDSITSGIGTGGQITMKASVPVFANTKYHIEIINTNQCHGPSRTPIDINVELSPAMPEAKDRNIVCLNTVTGPLDATALPGYFLQWYDTDKVTPLPGAPTPPTHQVDTIVYYVSQKSNGLQCESDKKPITVIISDLPGLVPNVVADSICPDAIPVIVINNSVRDYTYSLYDSPTGGVFMGSVKGTGNSVILSGSTPLTSSTIFYIATLNEYLCEGLQRTPVAIKVVASPNKPTANPLTIICLNTQAPSLVATADPGHYLQWYAPDGVTRLGNAPVPPTNKADTITYYVSQLSNAMDCESEKVPVEVIIRDLPELISSFIEPEICPDQYPTIIINHAYLNYTYNVYTAPTGGILVGSGIGAGGTLHILTSLPVPGSTTYYVEVLNDNQCVGPQRTPVNIKVINYVYIKPDKIPPYDRGKYYSVQLVTNAVPPYQWTVLQSLPYGFEFNLITGEITGTAPRQGTINPDPFTIKVVDKNGCMATKEYSLTSDLDVPENFSPNGDGINDHFMKEKRLIIFDRLGVKIFEGTDGWDGTYHGKPAPADVYYYVIFYRDYMDRDAHKTGFVNLLR